MVNTNTGNRVKMYKSEDNNCINLASTLTVYITVKAYAIAGPILYRC